MPKFVYAAAAALVVACSGQPELPEPATGTAAPAPAPTVDADEEATDADMEDLFDALADFVDVTGGCAEAIRVVELQPDADEMLPPLYLYCALEEDFPVGGDTPPAPRNRLVIEDFYLAADRETYYVEVSGVAGNTYCEAHMVGSDGRRTGEWTNELLDGFQDTVTLKSWDFDRPARPSSVEVECS